MNTRIPCLAALSLASLPCALARAQHTGDVFLTVEGGRIVTGLISQEGMFTPGVRVFSAEFGALEENFTNEPGFDSAPGTFPVPSQIGFRIRRALHEWNGSTFTHIAPEILSIDFGPVTAVPTPPCDQLTPGFTLDVGSNGQWHRHLEYTLGVPATSGIYLLELELSSNSPAISDSLPFWLVFLQPDPEQDLHPAQEAAISWVVAHLLPRTCAADFNGSGAVSPQDIFDFISAWFAVTPGSLGGADFNGSCSVTPQDLFDFLAAWFGPCP